MYIDYTSTVFYVIQLALIISQQQITVNKQIPAVAENALQTRLSCGRMNENLSR